MCDGHVVEKNVKLQRTVNQLFADCTRHLDVRTCVRVYGVCVHGVCVCVCVCVCIVCVCVCVYISLCVCV